MDSAGRKEEDVAGMDLVLCQDLRHCTVGHAAGILLRGNFPGKAGVEAGSGIGLNHVPHLRLPAEGRTMHAAGHLIVRMHLDGQVTQGVDELYQKGELLSRLRIHVTAKKLFLIQGRYLRQGLPLEGAFGNFREVLTIAGYLPGLPYLGDIGPDSFPAFNLFPSPDPGSEEGIES